MNKWYPSMTREYFPVEIWRHHDQEYDIAIRHCDGESYLAKVIKTYNKEDEDYEIIKKLWLRQYRMIHREDYKPYSEKKWWEFWK